MKIYYFNDTQDAMTIRVNHQFTFDPAKPYLEPHMECFSLAPQSGQAYEIDAPADSIPYVKVWSQRNVTLLSYMPLQALEQIAAPLPSDT